MTLLRLAGGPLLVRAFAMPVMAGSPDESTPAPTHVLESSAELSKQLLPDARWTIAMQEEIDNRIAAHRIESEVAVTRAKAAVGADRVVLMKEANARGEQLFLDILEIQARHARSAGMEDLALQLEQRRDLRLAAAADPDSRIRLREVPVDRQAPSQGGDR